jgi:hypothetical protein
MKQLCWLLFAILLSPVARAQDIEKVQPAVSVRNALLAKPRGVAGQVAAAARDFVTFRDPQWSLLTLGQIGAASADAVTSLNNFQRCPSCAETGVSRIFVGQHPDAHKYIVAGIIEIGIEGVTAHYFRNHGPVRKWYWKALWTLPQSFSLYEHAHAANRNAGIFP